MADQVLIKQDPKPIFEKLVMRHCQWRDCHVVGVLVVPVIVVVAHGGGSVAGW